MHQGGFGHLDFQLPWFQIIAVDHVLQFGGQIGHGELRIAQADTQHQVAVETSFPGPTL
ncbi:hypothetical protein D3C87_2010990 [compost metagenome]